MSARRLLNPVIHPSPDTSRSHLAPAPDLHSARRGFAVRRVVPEGASTLRVGSEASSAGDVLLVRVNAVGRLRSMELADGTVRPLEVGEEFVVCRGHVDETEANGPAPLQLVSATGVVAPATHRYGEETLVDVVGSIGDADGRVMNIAEWSEPTPAARQAPLPTIAVIGDPPMPGEAYRTFDIVRGLVGSGFSVGVANVTASYALWRAALIRRAGAALALDIVDAGRVTVRGGEVGAMESVFRSLAGGLAAGGVDVMVLEIEADVFDHHVAELISLPGFQAQVGSVVLEARDGTASVLARDSLRAMGFDVTVVDHPGQPSRYRRVSRT